MNCDHEGDPKVTRSVGSDDVCAGGELETPPCPLPCVSTSELFPRPQVP